MSLEEQVIILIGGTAGTGKTTLSNKLAYQLNITHRQGTGLVRTIIQTETTQQEDPLLYQFTFQGENVLETYKEQAARLYHAITGCIERARREGFSLIIEGSHLAPELYSKLLITTDQNLRINELYILKPHKRMHEEMVRGNTHRTRTVSDQEFTGIRTIDAYLKEQARKYHVPYCTPQMCSSEVLRKYKSL